MGEPASRRYRAWGRALLGAATVAATAAALQASAVPAQAAPAFQQVTLAKGAAELGEPMSLAVLPDRSVLHTARDGTVRRTTPAGVTTVAGKLSVYAHDEEGLQAIAADPGFATNRFVYLYYAPRLATPDGEAPDFGTPDEFAAWQGVNRLSRFRLGGNGRIDAGSERVILEVPSDRGICCHAGGDLDFDADGNLFLSTGDDTNPGASDGFAPIDQRLGRNPAYDAQRTAGSTDDLRGKLLRIKVDPDGGYSIPAGNLFPPGTPHTRPEIYAMGFRNPFRFSVDKATGIVYLGDHGADAAGPDPYRGPGGRVEFNRITGPGNYGWPYCTGRNDAYNRYDFDTGASGGPFDCDGGPVNASPNSTGLTHLPPAIPAWLPYDAGSVPELGSGSESPVGGPVYRYDPNLRSAVKFPASYDGDFFAAEFGRRWIKRIVTGNDGAIASINPFPWSGTQIMDLAFGPDGALYVLDYGTGFGYGDARSALYRIDYVNGGRAPVAVARAAPVAGRPPLTVRFSSKGSRDPDGDRLRYAWDFDGDGRTDATSANPTHTYRAGGTYRARLTVRDPGNRAASTAVAVTVGNTPPKLVLALPADGQVVELGEAVRFKVTVADREDRRVDCARVRVDHLLGHDHHGHLVTSAIGCSGTIQTAVDGEHGPGSNLFGVWTATYTDAGGLTGTDQRVTQPPTRQAEHFSAQRGIQVVAHADAVGARTVGFADNGDWIKFTPYDLDGVAWFSARVSSAAAGGTLELRLASPSGRLVGSAKVTATGSWDTFERVGGPVSAPRGGTALYLVFRGGKGTLFDLDEFTLLRRG